MEPIFIRSKTGKAVRIFGPFEYDRFTSYIQKDYHQDLFQVCWWTGMRYEEVRRLYHHPEWVMKERKTIHVPLEGQKKAKRRQLERYIHPIPPQLENILKYFFKGPEPPTPQSWNEDLKRWAVKAGFDPYGISAKTTRKSIESWMYCAGIHENEICLRQGHNSLTSMLHYQALPFTDAEKEQIKKRLSWF